MEKNARMLFYGLLTWLVPFVGSFPLYSEDGEPLYDIFLIKTLMIVVFGAFGAFLLVMHFRKVGKDYLREGIVVGVVWLVINWVGDLVFLVGAFGTDPGEWFVQIGARYLLIPIMAVSIGYSIEMKLAPEEGNEKEKEGKGSQREKGKGRR